MTIETGSVVTLNSGGQRMVADTSRRKDGCVDCFWFEGGDLRWETFPAACLTPLDYRVRAFGHVIDGEFHPLAS